MSHPVRWIVGGVLGLLLVAAGYSSLSQGGGFTVGVSSPDNAGGMTLVVAVPESPLAAKDGVAEYVIRYNGRNVYPPGGVGATFPVREGSGSIFVPYNIFVVGNGEYEVVVKVNGHEERVPTRIQKWVSYVFVLPQEKGSRVLVDLLLTKSAGGSPQDRVIAKGDLLVDLRYRGVDGTLNMQVQRFRYEMMGETPILRVEIPKSAFARGPGYYSFEATFHNDEAFGNNGVGNDPTLSAAKPPRNWIYYDG